MPRVLSQPIRSGNPWDLRHSSKENIQGALTPGLVLPFITRVVRVKMEMALVPIFTGTGPLDIKDFGSPLGVQILHCIVATLLAANS